MRITERDKAAIRFVAEVGAVRLDDLAALLSYLGGRRTPIGARTARGIVTRWRDAGFTEHHRVFHGQPSILVATRKGARLTAQPQKLRVGLPAVSELTHDLTTAAVAITYRCHERQWTGERLLAVTSTEEHRPDGLSVQGDTKIAVEVERTVKSRKRYETILPALLSSYDRVDYWVTEDTNKAVRDAIHEYLTAAERDRIRVAGLRGLLR